MCRSNTPLEAHDPPLLYNLHTDPGELYELDPDEYADVLGKIDRVSNYTNEGREREGGRMRDGKDRGKGRMEVGNQVCETPTLLLS